MGLSLFALGLTLIFVGALSFREVVLQESKFKKTLGWILGFVFVILGVVAIVADAKAEEPEYKLCTYFLQTDEERCMEHPGYGPAEPTNFSGCMGAKKWFEDKTAWHGKTRYCCIVIGDIVNKCSTNRSDQQKRIDSLMEHTELWVSPAERPIVPTIDPDYNPFPEIKE